MLEKSASERRIPDNFSVFLQTLNGRPIEIFPSDYHTVFLRTLHQEEPRKKLTPPKIK